MINKNFESINNNSLPKQNRKISIDSLIEKAKLEDGYAIYLNVYHLSIINYAIQIFGIGFFHTTLEINNIEYSFGATTENVSGIFYNTFGEGSPNIQLKEKIYLGNTIYNDETIKRLLCLYIPYWMGKSYDPFLKNCNHFTHFFAEKLLRTSKVKKYPDYVNRITEYVIFFHGFYSPIQRLYQNILPSPNSNGNIIQGDEHLNDNLEKPYQTENDNIKLTRVNSINNLNYGDVGDCCIEVGNWSNMSSPSRLKKFSNDYCNSYEKKNELFFDSVFLSNFFLTIYGGENKSRTEKNKFLLKLREADLLLFNQQKIKDSFTLYQELLRNIEKEKNISKKVENYLKSVNKKYIYIIDNNSKQTDENLIIKLKILHCTLYICYRENLLVRQEIVSNAILKINKNDFFAIFSIAYCKFKQNKFPECSMLIQNGINECVDPSFKKEFKKFQQIIDEFEF